MAASSKSQLPIRGRGWWRCSPAPSRDAGADAHVLKGFAEPVGVAGNLDTPRSVGPLAADGVEKLRVTVRRVA
jgi:hypothetical protein